MLFALPLKYTALYIFPIRTTLLISKCSLFLRCLNWYLT